MDRSITARRVATLVGGFDRRPAYAGLADALVLLIGDGRIPAGTRLPSERELTEALGVSRTTVTRAYATVRDGGYAEARRGSGTFTQVPGGPSRAHDRALLPRQSDRAAIDLNCAAPFAPPEIATAYAEAATRLPAYLGGHGYFPAGLPELQSAIAALYDARGLPTDPGPGDGDPRGARGGLDRGPGAGRPRRPGAGGHPRLPQRRRADPQRGRPAGDHRGGPGRLGPRRDRGPAAPGGAAAGLPDPRLPQPDRAADERRGAGAVRRRAASRARDADRRRVPRDAGHGGTADAASVRGVRPGHDHGRQREQGLLGRPAGRLGARAARA